METYDDDLSRFEAHGAAPLPDTKDQGYVEHDGARIYMDLSGVNPIEASPILNRCFSRHAKDYARLSATPERFKDFVEAVSLMQQTQPNYSAQDLAKISVPVVIVQSEHEEFIQHEHAEYLARSIPNAEFVDLPGVSHFAPLQRPRQFNNAMFALLGKVLP